MARVVFYQRCSSECSNLTVCFIHKSVRSPFRQPHQASMRSERLASCVCVGIQLRIGAVVVEFPGLALFVQANVQDFPQPLFHRGSDNGRPTLPLAQQKTCNKRETNSLLAVLSLSSEKRIPSSMEGR